MKFNNSQWFALTIACIILLLYFTTSLFQSIIFGFGVIFGMIYREIMIRDDVNHAKEEQ